MPSGGLVRHWKAGTDLLTFGSGLPEAESGSRGGGVRGKFLLYVLQDIAYLLPKREP